MIGAPTSIHGVQDMIPADMGFSRDQRRSRTTAPETSASSSRRAMCNPFARGCPSQMASKTGGRMREETTPLSADCHHPDSRVHLARTS